MTQDPAKWCEHFRWNTEKKRWIIIRGGDAISHYDWDICPVATCHAKRPEDGIYYCPEKPMTSPAQDGEKTPETSTEAIAKELAMTCYHYPPQDSELGLRCATALIKSALDTERQRALEAEKKLEKIKLLLGSVTPNQADMERAKNIVNLTHDLKKEAALVNNIAIVLKDQREEDAKIAENSVFGEQYKDCPAAWVSATAKKIAAAIRKGKP